MEARAAVRTITVAVVARAVWVVAAATGTSRPQPARMSQRPTVWAATDSTTVELHRTDQRPMGLAIVDEARMMAESRMEQPSTAWATTDPPQVELLRMGRALVTVNSHTEQCQTAWVAADKAPMTAELRAAACILAVPRAQARICILVAG